MRLSLFAGLALIASGCATSRFDRHLSQERWVEAATAFTADSALLDDPGALFRAAVLHSVPERPTYDPGRAAELFEQFIARFPSDARHGDAAERLALLTEIRALRAELRALKEIDLRKPE